MKLLRSLLLPLMLLLAAPVSQSATLGTLNELVSSTQIQYYPHGSFSDFVSFSLTEEADVTLGVSGLFANGTWGVYSSASFASLLYGLYGFDTETTLSELAAGTYYVGYTGTAPFDKGLVITGGLASPAPEPESYAMMLAGLGMLMLIVRRRART